MPDNYRFDYAEGTPYANAVQLIARHRRPGGEVVVDLGCGHGAVAEPLAALGLAYLGVDSAPDGLHDLAGRGFPTLRADLADPQAAIGAVAARLGEARPAAVLLLDVVEHLTNGPELLAALRSLVSGSPRVLLVVSVPNVSHVDLGAKLVIGRWDVTPTGLLDATHVSMYTSGRLDEQMSSTGWKEVGRLDFHLDRSDQHFPTDCVGLLQSTVLGSFLRRLRQQAEPNATVNQFVRAYEASPEPGRPPDEGRISGGTSAADPRTGEAPFLTVVVRTRCQRLDTLCDALLSLSAQSCQDFEVVLACHDADAPAVQAARSLLGAFPADLGARTRVVAVRGGGRGRPLNAGVEAARGRYVAFLDDDDVALGHWVETFRRVASGHPGDVVRSGAVMQTMDRVACDGRVALAATGAPTAPFPLRFELVEHLVGNQTPICALAIPASCFRDLGERFDEGLAVYEDWDFFLRAARLCHVRDAGEVTAVYRRLSGENSTSDHSEAAWAGARLTVAARSEDRPLLAPGSLVTELRQLVGERDRLRGAAEEATAGRARLDAEVLALRAALSQEQEAAARSQAEAAEARRRESAVAADLAGVLASRSWRAAAVFRSAGWLIRGGRPRPRSHPRPGGGGLDR